MRSRGHAKPFQNKLKQRTEALFQDERSGASGARRCPVSQGSVGCKACAVQDLSLELSSLHVQWFFEEVVEREFAGLTAVEPWFKKYVNLHGHLDGSEDWHRQ